MRAGIGNGPFVLFVQARVECLILAHARFGRLADEPALMRHIMRRKDLN